MCWGQSVDGTTMTRASDFKGRVRARMRATGEPYTAARAALLAEPPPDRDGLHNQDRARQEQAQQEQAQQEQQRIVARWFDNGRLRSIPARRKVRVAVLLEILSRFTPGETLTEPEIGVRLCEVHPDVAHLRRELVGYGYLTRADGQYRVSTEPPPRTPTQRRELPAWEQIWLPRFLAQEVTR